MSKWKTEVKPTHLNELLCFAELFGELIDFELKILSLCFLFKSRSISEFSSVDPTFSSRDLVTERFTFILYIQELTFELSPARRGKRESR